jgi:hypothetical protein
LMSALDSRINSEAPDRDRGPLSLSTQRTRTHASSRRAVNLGAALSDFDRTRTTWEQ